MPIRNFVSARPSLPAEDSVGIHIEKIAALKEALKFVRNLPEEMRLLGALSSEISALRELRELMPQGNWRDSR
jgi:hypothetical protein